MSEEHMFSLKTCSSMLKHQFRLFKSSESANLDFKQVNQAQCNPTYDAKKAISIQIIPRQDTLEISLTGCTLLKQIKQFNPSNKEECV